MSSTSTSWQRGDTGSMENQEGQTTTKQRNSTNPCKQPAEHHTGDTHTIHWVLCYTGSLRKIHETQLLTTPSSLSAQDRLRHNRREVEKRRGGGASLTSRSSLTLRRGQPSRLGRNWTERAEIARGPSNIHPASTCHIERSTILEAAQSITHSLTYRCHRKRAREEEETMSSSHSSSHTGPKDVRVRWIGNAKLPLSVRGACEAKYMGLWG